MFTNQAYQYICGGSPCRKITWILFSLSCLYIHVGDSPNYIFPVHISHLWAPAASLLSLLRYHLVNLKCPKVNSCYCLFHSLPPLHPIENTALLSKSHHYSTQVLKPGTWTLFFSFSLPQTPHPVYKSKVSTFELYPKTFHSFHLHCHHPNPSHPHLLPGTPS